MKSVTVVLDEASFRFYEDIAQITQEELAVILSKTLAFTVQTLVERVVL